MRRLPIFLLLDVSESMVGDNLRQLQEGLTRLISKLRTDPHALETVFISTLVFAGKARTLTPLTELVYYYPPRLPLGSGTSLGLALNHLMDEIERNVIKSSSELKGDWKPVVYLMTDGKPTDDVSAAITRWQEKFAKRVTLVAIAIGSKVALGTLRQLSENVIQVDAQSDDDFKRFVDWLTMSVVAQSRSVSMSNKDGVNLAKLDDSIMKKIGDIIDAAIVDDDVVALAGKCTTKKLPYLIKYERPAQQLKIEGHTIPLAHYYLAGAFALERDYEELSDTRALVSTVHSDALIGSPACPHCANPIGFAYCSCGQIMCISGPGQASCPTCNQQNYFDYGDGGFDVQRSRG